MQSRDRRDETQSQATAAAALRRELYERAQRALAIFRRNPRTVVRNFETHDARRIAHGDGDIPAATDMPQPILDEIHEQLREELAITDDARSFGVAVERESLVTRSRLVE